MNKNKKIIIVEDDEDISKVYEIKFAKEDLLVFTARDGEEAIIKITAEKPDMILLDLMLPKKDGFEVLGEIKKNHSLAKIPVIILSNLSSDTDKERCLTLGANEFLVKVDHPIQDIINKVHGYLGL